MSLSGFVKCKENSHEENTWRKEIPLERGLNRKGDCVGNKPQPFADHQKWSGYYRLEESFNTDGDNDGDGAYNDDDGIFWMNLEPLYLNLCIKNVIDAVSSSLI